MLLILAAILLNGSLPSVIAFPFRQGITVWDGKKKSLEIQTWDMRTEAFITQKRAAILLKDPSKIGLESTIISGLSPDAVSALPLKGHIVGFSGSRIATPRNVATFFNHFFGFMPKGSIKLFYGMDRTAIAYEVSSNRIVHCSHNGRQLSVKISSELVSLNVTSKFVSLIDSTGIACVVRLSDLKLFRMKGYDGLAVSEAGRPLLYRHDPNLDKNGFSKYTTVVDPIHGKQLLSFRGQWEIAEVGQGWMAGLLIVTGHFGEKLYVCRKTGAEEIASGIESVASRRLLFCWMKI